MSYSNTILGLLSEKHYDAHDWYDTGNLVLSMQHAIIIRLSTHFYLLNDEGDAKEYQAFLASVLSLKPYSTSHRAIIDLCSSAASMVIKDWDRRMDLIDKFLYNTRTEDRERIASLRLMGK